MASSADYAHPHFRHHPHSAHSTPSLLGLSPLTNFRDLALDEPYSRPQYAGANNSPYLLPNSLNFDSSRPAHPSSAAMERALDLFQEHFEQEDGGRFLWLHAEALRHTWRERALPAPVANCIAALSLRYADGLATTTLPLLRSVACARQLNLLIMAWFESGQVSRRSARWLDGLAPFGLPRSMFA